MTKKEIIWREILHQAIENKKMGFTQKELAGQLRVSLSTVFHALKLPRRAGAVAVFGKGFRVRDAEKFLYLWATHRNIEKETAYKTRAAGNVGDTEGAMPQGVVFALFSAYKEKYNDVPADYDHVYVYADKYGIDEIKKRFPPRAGTENLTVLKSDPRLADFGLVTPNTQTFVDLWSAKEWYAREFLEALKKKMF